MGLSRMGASTAFMRNVIRTLRDTISVRDSAR